MIIHKLVLVDVRHILYQKHEYIFQTTIQKNCTKCSLRYQCLFESADCSGKVEVILNGYNVIVNVTNKDKYLKDIRQLIKNRVYRFIPRRYKPNLYSIDVSLNVASTF